MLSLAIQRYSKKIAAIVCIAAMSLSFLPLLFVEDVYSKTSAEIQQEIEDQKNKLNQTEEEINNLQNSLEISKQNIENAAEGIPKLEAQITELEQKLELNKKALNLLKEQNELKVLEKLKLEINQKKSVKSSYIDWKTSTSSIEIDLIFKEPSDFTKAQVYGDRVFGIGNNYLADLGGEIKGLKTEIDEYSKLVSDLNKQNEELESKRKELENEIAYFNNVLAYNSNQINALQEQQSFISEQISFLSDEQRAAAQKEAELMQNGGGGTFSGCVAEAGKICLSGQGRDLYQGHGVGMSQWGAHGAGKNGWSANDIITFYYQGTSVSGGYENRTLNVDGYGSMNIEQYVAGMGEVPRKACGTQQQANSNPSKYVADNPNTEWDCWPEEAIKAQAIAFRTYAISRTQGGGSICTTAACQVYDGTTGTNWAAVETKGKVVTYGGNVIEALYSSDNSQGYGTANNDTIFQSTNGDGWPVPYLRAVNDSSFATQTQYTYWNWNTKSYTIQQIDNFLANSSLSGIKSSIGTLANIEMEFDPSNRVKKVWLVGQNGSRASVGGWWFKNVWNTDFACNSNPCDFIYSQTFNK